MSQYARDVGETTPMLSFEDRDGGPGLTVVDHVENRRCEVRTSDAVSPTAVSAEKFQLPVDCAVAIEAESLSIPYTVTSYVRNEDGNLIEEATRNADLTFSTGVYQIEFTSPIKIYLVVESAFEIIVTSDDVTIVFDRNTEVYLGARSSHDNPIATITTTNDPEDLIQAVSTFGAALKTTSCERSYPSLRGHPPILDIGDDLSIPKKLDIPDTGVTIEVPPKYELIYVIAPLAYYFGAEIELGSQSRLIIGNRLVHQLDDGPRVFEEEVERVLKQCFFLDCITRTEGHYPVDLHERNEVEDELDLDFSTLYGSPILEQLETYLGVPYDIIENYLPKWKITAHVDPIARNAAVLPFLTQNLATIRTREAPPTKIKSDSSAESLGITDFVRKDEHNLPKSDTPTDNECRRVVKIEESTALEDIWIGEGIPIGASKGMIEAFQNGIEREPSDSSIDITVIVNDTDMADEGRKANEAYRDREDFPFDVTIFKQLTKNEFEKILSSDTDFLHYIGHISKNGFKCIDGVLNIENINTINVDAFLLNACNSYIQGKKLIEAGATAGVVTLSPVSNKEASRLGENLARLLNLGYPFYAAMNIANLDQSFNNYLIIGDSLMNITQSDGSVPCLCDIDAKDGEYELIYKTFPSKKRSIGSITKPFISDIDELFLTSGDCGSYILNEDRLSDFLSTYNNPISYDSKLFWSPELGSSDNELE